MKLTLSISVLLVCGSALFGCARPTANAPAETSSVGLDVQTPVDDARTENKLIPEPANTRVSPNFSSYASNQIGDNKRCVVGAELDEDGMHQKPIVYVAEAAGGHMVWSRTLPLPPDVYQGRATHCLLADNSLYVLLQSDTQQQQSLSQTLLRVVKLSVSDGALQAGADISVPAATDAYSAWVDEGQDNFHWRDDVLLVSGHYFRLADSEQRKPFQVSLREEEIQ